VATILDGCTIERGPVAEGPGIRSLRAFERRLRSGGTLHVVDESETGALSCKAVRLGRGSIDDGTITSDLSWRDVDDDGRKFTVGYTLEWNTRPGPPKPGQSDDPTTHELTVLGPGYTYDDGSVSAFGCGNWTTVRGGTDMVDLGTPHYLTAAACRRAIAAEKTRRRWRPPPIDPDDAIASSFGPGIAGC
jgi:hypothetical protein